MQLDSGKLLETAFNDDENNQIHDAVVTGCSSSYVLHKILEEGHDLTFTRMLEVALGEDSAKTGKESVNHIGQRHNKASPKRLQQPQKSKSEQHCYRCGKADHFGKDLKHPTRGQ